MWGCAGCYLADSTISQELIKKKCIHELMFLSQNPVLKGTLGVSTHSIQSMNYLKVIYTCLFPKEYILN